MATANLPGFAPSCDGAAELFFVNVKHRGIRRHIIHDLFQRLKRHWRTGITQVLTFTWRTTLTTGLLVAASISSPSK